MYQRILLAVDLTSDSHVVGRRARTLADAFGAQLRVISVIEPAASIDPVPPALVGSMWWIRLSCWGALSDVLAVRLT